MALGSIGTILTSPNGVTWTTRASGTKDSLYGVTYGNFTFVAVGYPKGSDGTTILTSPDGMTWTERTIGTSTKLFEVTYGNSTFVAVGYGETVLTSSDGVTWTTMTRFLSGRSNILYGGNLWQFDLCGSGRGGNHHSIRFFRNDIDNTYTHSDGNTNTIESRLLIPGRQEPQERRIYSTE